MKSIRTDVNKAWFTLVFGLALISVLCSICSPVFADDKGGSTTFIVKNGAFPWSDRVDVWQLVGVPASVEGNGPLPQQICSTRVLTVPDGAKYILLGVSEMDVDKFKASYAAAQPTGETLSVSHADGTGVISYTIFKLPDPPASIGDGTFGAGLILLQVNDKPASAKAPAAAK